MPVTDVSIIHETVALPRCAAKKFSHCDGHSTAGVTDRLSRHEEIEAPSKSTEKHAY